MLKYNEMETQEVLEIDGEMVELLIRRYRAELDWSYLEEKTKLPENDTLLEILELKKKVG